MPRISALLTYLLMYCAIAAAGARQIVDEEAYDANAPAYPVIYTEKAKQDQRNAGVELVKAIFDAAKRGEETFEVTRGVYRVPSGALRFGELSGFTLDGHNSELIIEPRSARSNISLVDMIRCEDVTIKNLILDSDPPAAPVAELERWDAEEATLDVVLLPGYDADRLRSSGRILLFDRKGELLPTGMFERKNIERLGGRRFRLDLRGDRRLFTPPQSNVLPLRKGLLLALENDSGSLLAFKFCRGIRLEDITSYVGKFIIWERDETGPNHFYRVRTLRRPGTSRLIGGEGPQSSYIRGGPTLDQCAFTYSFDDGTNLCSTMAMVYEQRSPREIIVQPRWKNFDKGSTLCFYDYDSFEKTGTARIIDLERIDDRETIERSINMGREKPMAGFGSGGAEQSPWLVKLDSDLNTRKYAIVTSSDHKMTGFAVRNCHYRGNQARAILINGPSGGVIEDNLIENTGMAGIAIQCETWFLEGPFSSDIVVRGNEIIRSPFMTQITIPNRGDNAAIYVGANIAVARQVPYPLLENITLESNTIRHSLFAGILLSNVRGAVIRNNTIIDPVCSAPLMHGLKRSGEDRYGEFPGAAIYVTSCENVTIRDNRIEEVGTYCPEAIRFGKYVDGSSVTVSNNTQNTK